MVHKLHQCKVFPTAYLLNTNCTHVYKITLLNTNCTHVYKITLLNMVIIQPIFVWMLLAGGYECDDSLFVVIESLVKQKNKSHHNSIVYLAERQ